ncbi:MAG: gliding motility-associated C-terminal domain-containing protein [Bacteroidota bacterium]
MRKFYGLLAATLLSIGQLYAQPANNNCETAINIDEVFAFCSEPNAFTNVDATPSGYDEASCFTDAHDDVWFSFVALRTDVTVIIRGATDIAPGGTLENPEATIYEGICGGTLGQLECQTDNERNDIIELYQGGLVPGQTYLIRVQGRNGRTGTFQLCLNNFNPPADPSSDCPTASVLCDKSAFTVQNVRGAGQDRREMDDALCFANGSATNIETNSVWYTWICDEPGELVFTLTPSNETDDLDFVVYELPNGLDDCSGKRVLRCMASGDFAYPSRCMGPTGLRIGERDNDEPAGCNLGRQNSFLSPLDMEAGKAYALAINNFTSTNNGLSIEFGGTGTFRGPEANFTLDASIDVNENDNTICLGETISFTDASNFDAGTITEWDWVFGTNAAPSARGGEGPHEVSYSTSGPKLIALTIETDLGCTVTEVTTINVVEPPTVEFELATLPDCGGGGNGEIEVSASGGSVPYEFAWDGSGVFSNETRREGLTEGTYSVIVKDEQNCTSEPFEIFLPEDSIQLNESVIPVIEPSCASFSDGILVVSPIRGSAPYEFNFGSGFVQDSTLDNITAGSYVVDVRDANGCSSTFSIDVGEPDSLQLMLDALDISCKGQTDGRIAANISGGVGGYTFQWNNGELSETIENLSAGSYNVNIEDANGCEITASTLIIEPEGIDSEIADILNVLCPGGSDGGIQILASGGTPPFEYGIVGGGFQRDSIVGNLTAGMYEVMVRDSRGCEGDVLVGTITQPDSFFVDAGADQTVELGFEVDLNAVVLPFNKNIVEYIWTSTDSLNLSCNNCPDPAVLPFNNAAYTITVLDENGCPAVDEVLIRVEKNRPVFVPSVFSPLSIDTANRWFTLFGGRSSRGIKTLRIFSRWGDMVFETNDIQLGIPEQGWNGTTPNGDEAASGVYAFYAEVEFIDNAVIVVEGDVTLLR